MSNYIRLGIGMWPDDPFWVQVIEAIYQRGTEARVELIPITRSNFRLALTTDEKNALLEEIVSQELDVLIGWCFPEHLAETVLDMGTPIVHLSETAIEHALSVSPIGLQKASEELAHYLARFFNSKGKVPVICWIVPLPLPDEGPEPGLGV